MKNGISMLFTLSVAFALSAASSAMAAPQPPVPPKLKPFTYRLKVPATATSCDEQAGAIAQVFERDSKVAKSVTGICQGRQTLVNEGRPYEIDVVLIQYMAERELHPNRSIFGAGDFFGQARAESGIFATYADCLDTIAAQSPIFTQMTQLSILTAYCQASTHSMYPGFSMTIESFGEAKVKLWTFSRERSSFENDDQNQILQAAHAAIQITGGQVVYGDSLRLFYYSQYQIPVAVAHHGYFDDSAQCTQQVAEVQTIYTKSGLLGVSAFCRTIAPPPGLPDHVGPSYGLNAVGSGSHLVSARKSERYDTFSECMSELPRLKANATSNGIKVLGGICTPNVYGQGGFNAEVFSTY